MGVALRLHLVGRKLFRLFSGIANLLVGIFFEGYRAGARRSQAESSVHSTRSFAFSPRVSPP